MKKINYLSLLLVLLLVLNCKRKEKRNNDLKTQNNTKKNKLPDEVNIFGKSDDKQALEYLNIQNNNYLFGKEHQDIIRRITRDSLHLTLNAISKPQLTELWAFSDNKMYKSQIYIKPSDTILFEIKKGKLTFLGKHKIQNNFYTKLYNSTRDYNKLQYRGSINTYKQNLKSIYEEKISYFNKYIDQNKIVSKDFINTVKIDLKHQYLNNLIIPRTNYLKAFDLYYGDPNSFTTIIEKEYSNKKEVLFNAKEYFDKIDIEEFKKEGLISNRFFKNNINSYIRHYFDTSNHIPYSKEKLLAEKEFIEKNLDNDLQSYAIARMIRDYDIKGFGYSINNIEFMKSLISEYENKFTKASYRKKMSEIKEGLKLFNFSLDELALKTKLLNKFGDTTTLNNIFSKSNKRIRVINFWASWCAPCISEIIKVKSFKDKLSIESNVEWIYLSIDEDKKKWLKKSEELKDFLNVRNQYLVIGGTYSYLAKSLKVSGVPRYIILNKENKIVLNNAPRPSDHIIFKKIIDDIN